LGPNILQSIHHKNIGNTSKQTVNACSSYSSTLKMEATSCFVVSVNSYQITRFDIAERSAICGLSNFFRNVNEKQFLIRKFCFISGTFVSLLSLFGSSRACAASRMFAVGSVAFCWGRHLSSADCAKFKNARVCILLCVLMAARLVNIQKHL
jgi:hypothetical protein